MRTRFALALDWLRSSFWFVPAAMAFLAGLLAAVSLSLDELLKDETIEGLGWVYGGGPEGARALLSTVAGSMITVAGVVFSITIVALTLASSQFGPRLLRTFMRDRGNQVVLGAFIATYLYCLLVLRTVRGTEEQQVVPHLSVTIALLLSVLSLGVLIYFIHHVAASIQASNLIAAVSSELGDALERLFPEKLGKEAPGQAAENGVELPAGFEEQARTVRADAGGYIQAVDNSDLLRLAEEHDLVLRLIRRPGHFVAEGTMIVLAWPAHKVDDPLARRIRIAFVLGAERTPTQDVEFAVDQLVEIAVRALSPGLNDPFTAMTCLDRLGEALGRLASRTIPSPYRYDEAGKLRLIAEPTSFAGVVDAAFNQIRQYGRSSAAVTIRLLETIGRVSECVRRPEDLAALNRHAEMVLRGTADGLPEPEDRRAAEKLGQQVMANIERVSRSRRVGA